MDQIIQDLANEVEDLKDNGYVSETEPLKKQVFATHFALFSQHLFINMN